MRSGCRGCKAKDEHIESLKEQIEFFRLQAGTPSFPKVVRQETEVVDSWVDLPWVSEEEEEIMALRQAGLINPSDAQSALEQIGALSTEVSVGA